MPGKSCPYCGNTLIEAYKKISDNGKESTISFLRCVECKTEIINGKIVYPDGHEETEEIEETDEQNKNPEEKKGDHDESDDDGSDRIKSEKGDSAVSDEQQNLSKPKKRRKRSSPKKCDDRDGKDTSVKIENQEEESAHVFIYEDEEKEEESQNTEQKQENKSDLEVSDGEKNEEAPCKEDINPAKPAIKEQEECFTASEPSRTESSSKKSKAHLFNGFSAYKKSKYIISDEWLDSLEESGDPKKQKFYEYLVSFERRQRRHMDKYVPQKKIVIRDTIISPEICTLIATEEIRVHNKYLSKRYYYKSPEGFFFSIVHIMGKKDQVTELKLSRVKKLLEDDAELYKKYIPDNQYKEGYDPRKESAIEDNQEVSDSEEDRKG